MCNPLLCGNMPDPLRLQAANVMKPLGKARKDYYPDMQRPSVLDSNRNYYAGRIVKKTSGTSLA